MKGFQQSSVLAERTCLQCMRIPGLQPWAAKSGSPARVDSEDANMFPCDILLYHANTESGSGTPFVNQIIDVIAVTGTRTEPEKDESGKISKELRGTQRLHAIKWRKGIMFTPIERPEQCKLTRRTLISSAIEMIGSVVKSQVAAEIILLAACARAPEGLSAGNRNARVNLFQAPLDKSGDDSKISTFCAQIADCLGQLFPSVISVPVSTSALNKRAWMPVKNFDTDRLEYGVLQACPSTVFLLDETKMKDGGQLTDIGTNNFAAVTGLIKNGQIPYDFGVYSMPFSSEVTVLTVSEVPSGFQPGMLEVCLGKEDPIKEDNPQMGFPALDQIRCIINDILHDSRPIKIPSEVQAVVTQSFVNVRQEDKKATSALFINWMNLARASVLLHGEDELTRERWELFEKLDATRREHVGQYDGDTKKPQKQ
eukprot:Selendium_serpulae@DN5218_c0_g1_i1.p1